MNKHTHHRYAVRNKKTGQFLKASGRPVWCPDLDRARIFTLPRLVKASATKPYRGSWATGVDYEIVQLTVTIEEGNAA